MASLIFPMTAIETIKNRLLLWRWSVATFASNFLINKKFAKIMNQQVVIWMAVVALMLLAFLIRELLIMRKAGGAHGRRRHVVEMGKEFDMFYCPGDKEEDDEY